MEDSVLSIPVCHSPGARDKSSPRGGRETSFSSGALAAMERADYWDDYGVKTGMEIAFGLPDPDPASSWKVLEEEKPEEWSSVCLHFTQNTTFHGINKITENTPFPVRRVIWVLIVLGGLSLFLIQMVGSVLHYLEYPVTVNTRIIYNKTVTFPAVTICNQNVFRISQAAYHGHYLLIDKIYRNDSLQNLNLSEPEINATHTTLKLLYDDTAHDKRDMIVRCIWDRQSCSADDFVTTITDHGVCYTFNSGKVGPVKMASQTGSDRGLRLKLNIEQYEYMRGPNSAAGAKILVHDQAEVPFVRDFGQAISPGSHAFVGVQMTQINNLKEPHGECRAEVNLQFFTDYNIPNCQVDCMANYLRARCNCRLVHMPDFPDYPGEPLYCTFGQMQQCVEPELEAFELGQKTDSSANKCNCPVPCKRHKFDTTISYGTTSNFDTEQQGRGEDNEAIHRRFVNARETAQRVDTHIIESDFTMVRDLEKAASNIGGIFEQIAEKMHNITVFLDDVYYDLSNRTHFHSKYGLMAVQRALQYGFTQVWDIDQQHVFIPLSSGTKQLLIRYRKAMPLLVNTSGSPLAFRQTVAWHQEELLSSRLHMAQRTREVLGTVYESILSGTPMLPYPWAVTPRYSKVTVPRPLLRNNVPYLTSLHMYLVGQVNTTISTIKKLRHMVRHAFHRHEWNETYFHELRATYMESIELLSYGHNTFKMAIFDHMEVLISKRISAFSKLSATMVRERADIDITIQNFNGLVDSMKEDVWPAIVDTIRFSHRYNRDVTLNKTTLAGLVTSADIDARLQQMADVFIDVRARARNLDHDWRKFRDAHIKVWKSIKGEDTTRELYYKLHQDFATIFSLTRSPNSSHSLHLLGPLREQLGPSASPWTLYRWTNADIVKEDEAKHVAATKLRFKTFMEELGILSGINEKDDNFFKVFNTWRQSLRNFVDDSSIDDNFFKENFLEIDVYMTELYYELVEQREAYDLTNLWSDIGGSMGLFVGASVITVFELIDAMLHNFLKVQLQETKQRRRSIAIARTKSQREAQADSKKSKDSSANHK